MIYWIIFLILDGIADAFLYNVKDHSKANKPNEHGILWLRRALVAFALFQFDYFAYIPAFLVSFYLHDTPYYFARHVLNKKIYKDWYWTTSTTSTAWSDKFMNATVRAIMLQVGLFIYDLNYAIVAACLMLVAFGIGVRNFIRLR